MKLERMREICEGATPGPWRAFSGDDSDYGAIVQAPADCSNGEPILHIVADDPENDWPVRMSEADATFIATFSPERVRLLLDVVSTANEIQAEMDRPIQEHAVGVSKTMEMARLYAQLRRALGKLEALGSEGEGG